MIRNSYDTYEKITTNPDKFFTILLDVNGTDKGNNCTAKTLKNGKTPNTFSVFIAYNGTAKINPDDTWAIEAIKVNSKLNE